MTSFAFFSNYVPLSTILIFLPFYLTLPLFNVRPYFILSYLLFPLIFFFLFSFLISTVSEFPRIFYISLLTPSSFLFFPFSLSISLRLPPFSPKTERKSHPLPTAIQQQTYRKNKIRIWNLEFGISFHNSQMGQELTHLPHLLKIPQRL